VDSSFEFCDAEDCLEPGDKIVLYTDGVTEARHGAEMFGPERLEEVLAEHGSRSPSDLLDSIISAVTDWGDGQLGDDTAVIIVERM
jgi:serine phosphatase RsbU (regulator of sigma subunit)